MHALILDPGLSTPIGHHYNLDACLVQELAQLGMPARIISHAETAPVIVEKLGTVPHFRSHPYLMRSTDQLVGPLEDYLEFNEVLATDLASLASKVDWTDALVILHTVNDRMLFGLARWLGSAALPDSCKIMIVLPHESGLDSGGKAVTWKALLYRHAFNVLNRLAGGRASLLTLSELQVRDFGLLSGQPVKNMPYPSCAVGWRRANGAPQRSERPRRRVLYCGEATRRKGFDLLPEIIRKVSAARADAEFVIQLHGWHPNDPLLAEVASLTRTQANVHTVSGFTLPEDFYRLLDDADLIVLPYQAPVYKAGTSAIFEEAMYLGCPCVVPPETMMATALGRHPEAGAVAADASAAALADAVLRVLADYPRYQAGAMAASLEWRARDGIDRFAQFLVDQVRSR
ncbi:MAG: glycosyltransferase [Proteobacteria bacterium]|nr:glycosyltransferase [Pseudomonadota bacterium]MBI3498784.1 glycosyltransferase [Pseudomonadota bacterium]